MASSSPPVLYWELESPQYREIIWKRFKQRSGLEGEDLCLHVLSFYQSVLDICLELMGLEKKENTNYRHVSGLFDDLQIRLSIKEHDKITDVFLEFGSEKNSFTDVDCKIPRFLKEDLFRQFVTLLIQELARVGRRSYGGLFHFPIKDDKRIRNDADIKCDHVMEAKEFNKMIDVQMKSSMDPFHGCMVKIDQIFKYLDAHKEDTPERLYYLFTTFKKKESSIQQIFGRALTNQQSPANVIAFPELHCKWAKVAGETNIYVTTSKVKKPLAVQDCTAVKSWILEYLTKIGLISVRALLWKTLGEGSEESEEYKEEKGKMKRNETDNVEKLASAPVEPLGDLLERLSFLENENELLRADKTAQVKKLNQKIKMLEEEKVQEITAEASALELSAQIHQSSLYSITTKEGLAMMFVKVGIKYDAYNSFLENTEQGYLESETIGFWLHDYFQNMFLNYHPTSTENSEDEDQSTVPTPETIEQTTAAIRDNVEQTTLNNLERLGFRKDARKRFLKYFSIAYLQEESLRTCVADWIAYCVNDEKAQEWIMENLKGPDEENADRQNSWQNLKNYQNIPFRSCYFTGLESFHEEVLKFSKCDGPLVFHATSHNSAVDIIKSGIDISLGSPSQDFSNRRGFYVSEKVEVAIEWAEKNSTPAILIYDIEGSGYDNPTWHLKFTEPDANWKKLIQHCRSGNKSTCLIRDYNNRVRSLTEYYTIYGPMCGNPSAVKRRCIPKPHSPYKMQLCVRETEPRDIVDKRLIAAIFWIRTS